MQLPWSKIETVLLDMDGTLLDLRFDNYFWLEYLPCCYAKAHHLSLAEAQQTLFAQYATQQGLLTWYCIDYWTRILDLPLLELKQQISHLIKWRKNAEFFLKKLNEMGKYVILITNAHPKSLALKMQKVDLTPWFKHIISSHQYGYPKENSKFWQQLQLETGFVPANTLFVDDSIKILDSAQHYGVAFLCAIEQPDSELQAAKTLHHFPVIKDFKKCFTN